jgi:hypothetical protein
MNFRASIQERHIPAGGENMPLLIGAFSIGDGDFRNMPRRRF